jgi:hypothetical protein
MPEHFLLLALLLSTVDEGVDVAVAEEEALAVDDLGMFYLS